MSRTGKPGAALRELLWRIDGAMERIGWGHPPLLAMLLLNHQARKLYLRSVPGFDIACGFYCDAVQAVTTLRQVFEDAPGDIKCDWFDGDTPAGVIFVSEATQLLHRDACLTQLDDIEDHPNAVPVRMTMLVDRHKRAHILLHERDGIAHISEPDEWIAGDLIADMARLLVAIL